MAGDSAGRRGGPPLGRLNKQAGGAPLLSGYQVFLEGPFAMEADVVALLRAAGAKLLTRPPVAGASSRRYAPSHTILVLRETDGGSQPGELLVRDSASQTAGEV